MKKHNLKNGFTIIELTVAVTLFIVIMTISMGSLVSLFDANRKSRSIRTVMTNLNLSLETMSKEMRYGRNYHCQATGTITSPQNCPGGGNYVSFLSSAGVQTTYFLSNGVIYKEENNGSAVALTAPEVFIDNLTFYVVGAQTGDTLQPKAVIYVKGYAGSGKNRSDFTVQTLVSQRRADS